MAFLLVNSYDIAMLPKKYRLTTKDFDQVFKNHTARHADDLMLLVPSHKDGLESKYAVVVSKKTYSRRVDRNKLRRIIYHLIKPCLQENIEIKSGIIMVKKPSRLLDTPLNQLKKQVNRLVIDSKG